MKINRFFIIALLGVAVFSGINYSSQEPEKESYAERIYNWIWGKSKRAKENVVKTVGVASAASALQSLRDYGKGPVWYDVRNPDAILAADVGVMGLGAVVGGAGAVDYWNSLFSKDPIGILQGVVQMLTGSLFIVHGTNRMGYEQAGEKIAIASVLALSGAMITGLTVSAAHALSDYIKSGKTTDEQAVEKYKNILNLAISDPEAFPTIESKIYALNRPTNLGLNIDESDKLLYEAITQIINQLQQDPVFIKMQEIKKDLTVNSKGNALPELALMYHEKLREEMDELKKMNQYQSPEAINAFNQILIDSWINKTRYDERYEQRTLDQNLQAFENRSAQYKAFQSILSCLKKQKVAQVQATQQ